MDSATQTRSSCRRPKAIAPDWPRLVQRSVAVPANSLKPCITHFIPHVPAPSRSFNKSAFGVWETDDEVAPDVLYVSVDRGRKRAPKSPTTIWYSPRSATRSSHLYQGIHGRSPAPDFGRRLEFQALRERLRTKVLRSAFPCTRW